MTREIGELESLMQSAEEGKPCPTGCGGKIEVVNYSSLGKGVFLQCSRWGTIHYINISPPDPTTEIIFKPLTEG